MRTAVVVILLLLTVAACSKESDLGGLPVEVSDVADSDSPTDESIYDEPPYGPGVEVGEVYDYQLYVHCGIKWARIDGDVWAAEPLDEGAVNPPDGWGNPYDTGTLILIDETNAEYRGGPDATVQLIRTDLVEVQGDCY